ncbi:hypothetical protein GW17_00033509 [Ensete ventricosum]|nr:hypothetical protein GW17_00033509 [Ensete ventricosum]
MRSFHPRPLLGTPSPLALTLQQKHSNFYFFFVAIVGPPLPATEVPSLPTPSPLLPPTTVSRAIALPYRRYSSAISIAYLFHLSCEEEDYCP